MMTKAALSLTMLLLQEEEEEEEEGREEEATQAMQATAMQGTATTQTQQQITSLMIAAMQGAATIQEGLATIQPTTALVVQRGDTAVTLLVVLMAVVRDRLACQAVVAGTTLD